MGWHVKLDAFTHSFTVVKTAFAMVTFSLALLGIAIHGWFWTHPLIVLPTAEDVPVLLRAAVPSDCCF